MSKIQDFMQNTGGYTVGDLIEELKQFDENMPVAFAFGSGDYWRTVVAEPVRNLEERDVAYSDYHDKAKVLDEEDETERDEEKQMKVLIIGS